MDNSVAELIITIIGGPLGIHKFLEKDYNWGIAYLLTFDLLGIGWLFDIYACLYYRGRKSTKNKRRHKGQYA